MPRIIVIALSLFAITAAHAAPADKDNTYEVEVLVFRNIMPKLAGNELWTRDTVNTVIPDLATAASPIAAPPADPILTDAATVMSSNPRYQVLAHYSWIETADTRSASKPVRITASVSGNPHGLDGTVLFYMSRYLHVVVNLLLQESASDASAAGGNPAPNAPAIYRISEHRRIRSNETDYFDHPMFGALVRVIPLTKTGKAATGTR
ncbi:MAG: CsiV family protein [Acidiferrobacterales bacterium]